MLIVYILLCVYITICAPMNLELLELFSGHLHLYWMFIVYFLFIKKKLYNKTSTIHSIFSGQFRLVWEVWHMIDNILYWLINNLHFVRVWLTKKFTWWTYGGISYTIIDIYTDNLHIMLLCGVWIIHIGRFNWYKFGKINIGVVLR